MHPGPPGSGPSAQLRLLGGEGLPRTVWAQPWGAGKETPASSEVSS